jgi:hypothetical protein
LFIYTREREGEGGMEGEGVQKAYGLTLMAVIFVFIISLSKIVFLFKNASVRN